MKIYVACLAAYNAGILHGRWVELTDPETVRESIADMLKASPIPGAEEWAIHDYDLDGLECKEHEDVDLLCELAEAVDEHGRPFVIWWNNEHGRTSSDVERFQDEYAGTYKSLEDYAYESYHDCHEAPDKHIGQLANYIDWERYGRDLELGGDVWTHAEHHDEVYVYWNGR